MVATASPDVDRLAPSVRHSGGFKGYWSLVKQAGSDWIEDHASRLAASLAFYTMLSIAPLLVIALKVVGVVFGDDAAKTQVKNYVTELMGSNAGNAVAPMMGPIAKPGAGTLATVVSLVVLLFSASGVFGELQDSLNTIWEVKPRPGRTWLTMLRERFFSFIMVLGTCFILLVSLVVSTALATASKSIGGGQQSLLWNIVNFLVSIGIITVLFALIFKFVPDVKVKWRHVWFGAIATGVLFTVGKFLLGWYLGRGATTSVYGAAGSLVAMLLWVYYSAQILFFGAELVQARARAAAAGVKPADNAVKVTSNERAQQGLVSAYRLEDSNQQQIGAANRAMVADAMRARSSRAVLAAPSSRSVNKGQHEWGLKDYAYATGGAVLAAVAGGLAVEYLRHEPKKSSGAKAATAPLDCRIDAIEKRLRNAMAAYRRQH